LSELAGRVPRKGDTFTLEGRRFTVKEGDKRQVRWILVEDLPV
jgi:magnesium and cobalt transporter